MKMWRLCALIMGLAVMTVSAQKPGVAAAGADPRVKSLLEEAGLRYEVDGDGDYRVIIAFPDDNNRTQLVFIMSKTNQLRHMEVRDVWSVGYMGRQALSPQALRNLLEENGRLVLGQWSVGGQQGTEVAIFRIRMDARSDAQTLRTIVELVAGTADEMEKKLMGANSDSL